MPGVAPGRAPGLEVGADRRVDAPAIGILEVHVEVMPRVRLVPVDVDRDRDADDELRRELGEAKDVPRPAEDVELAVDRLGAVGQHQGVDVHGESLRHARAPSTIGR